MKTEEIEMFDSKQEFRIEDLLQQFDTLKGSLELSRHVNFNVAGRTTEVEESRACKKRRRRQIVAENALNLSLLECMLTFP